MTRPTTLEADLVLDDHADVGEGAIWHPDEQALYWVDITRNLVHRYDPANDRDITIDVGQAVGAIALGSHGDLILAVQNGFARLDTSSKRVQMIANVEAENAGTRMNDGKCDSSGRFWAGTMAYDAGHGAGSVYRLETDGTVATVLTGVTISNGMGWSPDDTLMYYIDTDTGGVDVFDYDRATGAIGNRRRLITIAPDEGQPDGMTMDSEGYLWVALWKGSAVRRYSPTGELDRVITLPVTQVTTCAFGGKDFADLYITSAASGLSEDELRRQPHAGGLFHCRPGVVGLPAHHYGG